jgi:dihydrodipicolinate synthase/N-acetylneuraminate lyase
MELNWGLLKSTFQKEKAVSSEKEILPDGIYAMLVTPFYRHENIDYVALRREVLWCKNAGAQGIVVCPSIGEFACLANEERWSCFENCWFAARQYGGPDFRTIAMIAATNTREMLEHARQAKAVGYNAGQLIAPYYWIPDEEEVYDYFLTAAGTGLPIVVYHNPRLSKFKMSRKFLGRLARIPGVIAIKEVETDRHVELEPLAKELGETKTKWFTTFRAFLDGAMLGSNGGFINVFALPACVALWNLIKEGLLRDASSLQSMINETFPRGGEGNLKHIGTTKMAASAILAPRARICEKASWPGVSRKVISLSLRLGSPSARRVLAFLSLPAKRDLASPDTLT